MKHAFVSTLVLLASLTAQAQPASTASGAQTTTASRPRFSSLSTAANGVRVGIFHMVNSVEMKASNAYGSASEKVDLDNTNGISVGYALLPIRSFGFIGNLGFLQSQDTRLDRHLEMMRLELSAAYTISRDLYFKGGFNGAKFTNSSLSPLSAQVGQQLGLGVQVTRHVGVEISYVQMQQSGKLNSVSVDTKESGGELGITGTF